MENLPYQTHVLVHLDHIRANLEAVRRRVGPSRKLLAVVKADAYGHGAVGVSRLAEQAGAHWLGVATLPEGLQLRQAGLRLPILKLYPMFPVEMAAAIAAGITPTVVDAGNIQALEAIASGLGAQVDVHLAVDTGMGRIGLPPDAAPDLARLVEGCRHLRLQGLSSHLPVSDEPDLAFTQSQVRRFREAAAAVEAALGRRLELVHCANSGAILAHPDAWMDMVRAGVILYGFYPNTHTPRTLELLPGLSLHTAVSFLKQIPAGTRIGYGLTWAAPRDTWIATLPVGFGDGYSRRFFRKGRVLVNGRSYPVVGRICMDQIMVDLGPGTTVQVGDLAVLIGRSGAERITVEEWAEVMDTITYEVTCQINARVERVHRPAP
jgi:alanine racemase